MNFHNLPDDTPFTVATAATTSAVYLAATDPSLFFAVLVPLVSFVTSALGHLLREWSKRHFEKKREKDEQRILALIVENAELRKQIKQAELKRNE
jgi:hypothetical protein